MEVEGLERFVENHFGRRLERRKMPLQKGEGEAEIELGPGK